MTRILTRISCRKSFLWITIVASCVTAVPISRAESQAKLEKRERRTERHFEKFRTGTYLQVDLRDSTQVYGSLGRLSASSFQLTNSDTNAIETHSYAEVADVRRAKAYIGVGSTREHHLHLWVPVLVGAIAAGGGIAAYEMTR